MKKTHILAFTAILFVSIANAGPDLATITKNDKQYYLDRVDTIISEHLATGRSPTPSDLLDLRTAEMNFIMSVRADPSVARYIPPLYLTSFTQFRDTRYLPGQLVVAKCRAAGFDLFDDGLSGRKFERMRPSRSLPSISTLSLKQK
jgi:hypothetical protein